MLPDDDEDHPDATQLPLITLPNSTSLPPAARTSGLLHSLPSLDHPSSNIPPVNISINKRQLIKGNYRQTLNNDILVPIRAALVSHNFVSAGHSAESSVPNLEWIPRTCAQLFEAFTNAYRAGTATRNELVTLQTAHDSLRERTVALEESSASSEVNNIRLE